MEVFLLFSTLVVATCGLVYELIAGTLASYLLGDSVTQFSLIIGVYLFSMGIGSFLAQGIKNKIVDWFIQIEITAGLIGGLSAMALFLTFEAVSSFRVVLFSLVSIIGMLVGLEIPLLMRLLKNQLSFSQVVSRVLAVDYLGALLASLLFPLVMVPTLGLVRSALICGIANTLIGIWTLFKLQDRVRHTFSLGAFGIAVLTILTLCLAGAGKFSHWLDQLSYEGRIVHVSRSPYQKIVVTNTYGALELHLNGNLQFNSRDEYRYHESLVHPLMNQVGYPAPKSILVLGGGDGLAVRELLKYPSSQITLVELDPAMTRLFSTSQSLTQLNENALKDPRVETIHQDAFSWLRSTSRQFDAIFIDFPDPSNHSLGKLYSVRFYREIARHLTPGGRMAVQSTSPYFARQSYWCIGQTLRTAGFHIHPYHAYVPSFGEWGYFLATKDKAPLKFKDPAPKLRFLESAEQIDQLFVFPADMQEIPQAPNKLYDPRLVHIFEKEWGQWL